jgi:3-hydroxyacyl-CoA dehydrogenase/enoyl-CoA hydratase/3-hydroxybutyryl-CoA epimerase
MTMNELNLNSKKLDRNQTENVMNMEESIRIVPIKDMAIVELDMVGEKINKLNTPMMLRFKSVVEELAKSTYKAVIFVSKKPKIFIAGADIDEISSLKTPEAFNEGVQKGQAIFNLVEDLPMPTIAAIHGACMGGGTEFIMSCDYRIASDDSSTRIGLPETKLGIIPGFGGCVRMPRLIGLQAALDIILAGKSVNATKAAKLGLVDKAVHPAILLNEAIKLAEEGVKKGKRTKRFVPKGFIAKFLESSLGRKIVFSQARKGVLKLTHGHYPAPLKAIEAIEKTYGFSKSQRDAMLAIERACFIEAATTDVSHNLIHVYYLTEMVKKQSGSTSESVKPLEVRKIGILGAGTMGGGIAYIAADKGIDARMKDIHNEALSRGFKAARDLWNKLVKRKSITKFELQQKMSLISGATDFSGFGTMDVVVEAIVEDMEVKKKVIAETAKHLKPQAIMATNTSSLSVNEMSVAHPHPESFVGMHFFNPVDKMPLVEVIRGDKTSEEAVVTIFELAKKMGKMPVVVKDGPGFLVNRLLLPYMSEAAFLLQEGMSVEFVDKEYVKKFGMPMGPFALMDEVGLDVCIKVLKIFRKSFGERIEMAGCLDKLSQSKRLGKKNGQGFYQYSSSGKRLEVDQSIYSELGLPQPSNPLSSQECLERGVFAMINECSRAFFEDHIVATPHEVDLAMIMGTGFPPFRGGLLRYADSIGAKYVVAQLEKYSAKAPRLKPAAPLMKLAQEQKSFYN